MNGNFAFLHFHFLALAGVVVKRAALHLDRGVGGRSLANGAGISHCVVFPLLERDGNLFSAVDDLPSEVAGVGFGAEGGHCFIFFFAFEEEARHFRAFADQHDQQAGGKGIEGAAVADALEPEFFLEAVGDFGRADAGRFIYQQYAGARGRAHWESLSPFSGAAVSCAAR